ncbi:hypothetical protein [Pseudomonas fluorescens]|uniref:Uncharacterized protein n=1 Tax=Pseudomonas fluorescens TaxID=294 RepID=A0A5E7CZF4_PSEFL|nr:hypothetical protein PS691_02625 [Pseudomonas fluorescens]
MHAARHHPRVILCRYIRDLVSQSSAGANQTSAASHELSRLAVDLNAMLARLVI